jgi:hypothetical protein
MHLKAVKYKDVWLAPGSECYDLYHDTKNKDSLKKLDQKLKQLDADAKVLLDRYKRK